MFKERQKLAFVTIAAIILLSGCVSIPPENDELTASQETESEYIESVNLTEESVFGDADLRVNLTRNGSSDAEYVIAVSPDGRQQSAEKLITGESKVQMAIDSSHSHGNYRVILATGGKLNDHKEHVGGTIIGEVRVEVKTNA
ncbi:hypothetical protein [Halosimplex pelagicum]|uniref:Lipoprotein n=1 Tax=Halosimplex pelagicum TaxID=869886 RepID=A0A7D5PBB1_9EURY|nr:hypothetical protein [Halosimplex pelagicum]QLH82345.1 hypothetical protein HZS54_12285 [Halosimplex pelagicum]